MAKRRPSRRRPARRRVMRTTRRRPVRRNARKYGPSTRKGGRRITSRRAYVPKRRPARRRSPARRNPRVFKLIQSEAFGVGVAAVVGGVVAAQLEMMAEAPDSQLGKALGAFGMPIPAGIAGSVVTLILATQTKNARTRKYLVGAAAGMVTPAIIGAVQGNPRGLNGPPSYRRLARPSSPRTVLRSVSAPSTMSNTAQRFRLSTIPA